jgi:multiple sugar transport system substrate-binding protein
MTTLTRRNMLRGGIGLAGAALLAGCGSGTGGTTAGAGGDNALDVWDWSPAPDQWGEQQQSTFYSKTFPAAYPKMALKYTIFGYTDLLPKLTVSWRGGSVPDMARLAIAWTPQFVNEGLTAEISPSDLGVPLSNYWPQALQSVRKNGASSGPLYGIPTNNESMMLIYNKDLFKAAGLDPSHGPATWTDLVSYARTIHSKTGKFGYGMVAAQNNGNTPYRFCPMMWGYGGSIFDELTKNPTWSKAGINSAGTVAALELYSQMYNQDKSVQPSALSDQESDIDTLFAKGEVAMMIDHPNAAAQVHQLQPGLSMGADLIPAGPVRRAAVFGGSNLVIKAGTANMKAALDFVRAYETADNDTLLSGLGSNPANKAGFTSAAEKTRNARLFFNDVTLKMMPYGVNVPLVPQGSQIWNQTIPTMIQNVLTKAMSPKQAAADAESKIQQIMG